MSEINLLDLTGRTALVTGAGQGVGAATARYLAAYGAHVIVNDFVLDRAQAVADEIKAAGDSAVAAQADVTDFDAVQAMVADAGTVDILVNNAGNAGADPSAITGKPFWQADPTEWEPFIGVNLYGVFHCSRAVIPGMIEGGRGGRLITVISDAGRVGEPGLEAYSAAKAGAAGLIARARQEPRPVRDHGEQRRDRHDQHARCRADGAERGAREEGAAQLHDPPVR